jgi:hypothetical protein
MTPFSKAGHRRRLVCLFVWLVGWLDKTLLPHTQNQEWEDGRQDRGMLLAQR